MDGEYNVFECLGQEPLKREETQEPEEVILGVRPPDDTHDFDIFEALGFGPAPEKPQPVVKPTEPKQIRRARRFETAEIEKRYWALRAREHRTALANGKGLLDLWDAEERLKKWKEASDEQLLFDEPLHPTNDPYERDLHSTPHR